MLNRLRRSRGFTLIEVMVVIVILGVLAALVVPKVMSRPDEARVVAAKQDISAIMQALKLYKLDNRRYPSAEQGLQALVTKPPPRRCPTTGSPTSTSCPSTLGQALPVRHARPQGRGGRDELRRRRHLRRRRLRRRRRLLECL
jgi:prepilin-type N-terminal cleavage/methylation domain-containing protein